MLPRKSISMFLSTELGFGPRVYSGFVVHTSCADNYDADCSRPRSN